MLAGHVRTRARNPMLGVLAASEMPIPTILSSSTCFLGVTVPSEPKRTPPNDPSSANEGPSFSWK